MFSRILTGLSLILPLIAVLLAWSRPEAARPHPRVPLIRTEAGTGRTVPQVELSPPRPGLTQIPARITGRAARGDKGALLQEWPGFHAEAKFDGSSVFVRFADRANRWRISIDEGRSGRIELSRPGVSDLRIHGLAPGTHDIRVEKISESSMPASFGGILTAADALELPAPPERPLLIEFIGDSDTLGFASTASRRNCSEEEVFASTDTSRGFGPRMATALGADYRLIARSGIGLLRNFEGVNPQSTMLARYGQALPSDPNTIGLPERKADIIVTGLGGNDFGSTFGRGEPWSDQTALSRDFGEALVRFLRQRVQDNPGALQILLAFGEYGEALIAPYRHAEAVLRDDGERTALVVLPRLRRNACMWHPSQDDHAMIAEMLIRAASESRPP